MVKRVTLKQVAEHAGVSITTVSNYVRGWPFISEKTSQIVGHSIQELGYAPHPIAQGLRTGRTNIIGFIVPDLTNSHFASMANIVESIARQYGYNILLFNSHDDETLEIDCINQAVQRWVDGLIIVQAAGATKTTGILQSTDIPVVSIDRVPMDFEDSSCRVDNYEASCLIMEYLYSLGHRRIAHLAGLTDSRPGRERYQGYEDSVAKYNLDYQRIVQNQGGWWLSNGYAAMKELLEDEIRPTAVYASNDEMALGALHLLQETDLRVPQDISLVGIDDIDMSRYVTPQLTTVRQPLEAMTQKGIDMLLRLMSDDNTSVENHIFVPELVIRNSTAPPVN